MKKRNCRRTEGERAIHERATRLRKMTDEQLCDYIDSIDGSKEKIMESFFACLGVRSKDGTRVSDATIRKLRAIAQEAGFLPRNEK